MNKTVFLILVFLGLMLVTNRLQAGDKVGFRAGYQVSGMYAPNGQIGSTLPNFYFGFMKGTKIVTEIFTFQTGLEYMQGGWKTDDANFRRIHYLSIPLALRVKLGPFFAQAGINGNLRLAENYQLLGVNCLNDESKVPFFDMPVQAGVGVKIAVLTIEARYHYGLVNMGNDSHNAYLQLGLGISI